MENERRLNARDRKAERNQYETHDALSILSTRNVSRKQRAKVQTCIHGCQEPIL